MRRLVEGRAVSDPAIAAILGPATLLASPVFFRKVAARAREEAETAGVEISVDVRPGHAAELIVRYARVK